MTSLPCRWMLTGKTSVTTTSTASSGAVQGSTDQVLRLIRKPIPMPRNDPSRTKFEK